MNCSLCKSGEMKDGTATLTLERGGAVVVIRDVPALVCDQCGDKVYTEQITGEVLRLANEAVRRGIQVEIISFVPTEQQVVA